MIDSRDIGVLREDVAEKAEALLDACAAAGLKMLVTSTWRDIEAQAVLYRQSRTRGEIETKCQRLRTNGFDFLAEAIEAVGPRNGPHVTNAGPGESWHNYRVAMDAYPCIAGKPVWSYNAAPEMWDKYGVLAEQHGFEWAGRWRSFREYPHVQIAGAGSPLKGRTPNEVKEALGL